MADLSRIQPPRRPLIVPRTPATPDLITRPWLIGGLPPRATSAWIARRWLLGSLPGRTLLVGIVIKLVVASVRAVVSELPGWLSTVDSAGTLALVLGVGYVVARGAVWMRRRLLWRVRRKLILSYVFVGLVPSLLIGTFFLIAGLLFARNIASYLVQTRLDALVQQARFLAGPVLLDVQRATTAEAVRDTLERHRANGIARYPHLSLALVRTEGVTCDSALLGVNAGRVPPVTFPVSAGDWAHTAVPAEVPGWVPCDGMGGIVAYRAGTPAAEDTGTDVRLIARAVALPATRTPAWGVVLDLPIGAVGEERLRAETGIHLGAISDMRRDEAPPVALRGTALDARTTPDYGTGVVGQLLRRWVVVVEHHDWATGRIGWVQVMLS